MRNLSILSMKKKKMPILLVFVAFLFDCKIEIRKIPFSTNIAYACCKRSLGIRRNLGCSAITFTRKTVSTVAWFAETIETSS